MKFANSSAFCESVFVTSRGARKTDLFLRHLASSRYVSAAALDHAAVVYGPSLAAGRIWPDLTDLLMVGRVEYKFPPRGACLK